MTTPTPTISLATFKSPEALATLLTQILAIGTTVASFFHFGSFGNLTALVPSVAIAVSGLVTALFTHGQTATRVAVVNASAKTAAPTVVASASGVR